MRWAILPVAAVTLLTACATVPSGPSVMVLPGSGKNFDQFQTDNAVCRQFAEQQIGTTTGQASTESTVGGAGTLVGAALGAAVGAASGNPATGAAIGAGAGLVGGTAVGASAGQRAGISVQRRYDTAYMQCMYTKGNQIPVARGYQSPRVQPPPPPRPPAPPAPPPPPTPGSPPPLSQAPALDIPLPPPGPPPPPPPGPVR
jgi:outer membrane lipoprotein SlyB